MRWKLKIACLQVGKSQRRVALQSGIPENRFSEIVCGWITPTADERTAIVQVLGNPDEDVFHNEPTPDDQPMAIEQRGRRR